MADNYSVQWLKEMAETIGLLTGKEYIVDHAAGWCLREKLDNGCVQFLFNGNTKRELGQLMYAYRSGLERGKEIRDGVAQIKEK